MARRRAKGRNIPKKIVKTLDIPEDIVFDIPRILIHSNSEMRIENYKSILEYEAEKITLSSKYLIIEIKGEDLNICIITDDEISISGNILAVNFSKSRS